MLDQEKLIFEAENAIKWIRDYIESSNAKGVVVGNSGGKDSATVIAMATKALGRDRVLAIGMPCNSNPEDLNDARLVAQTFGINMLEVDLTNAYNDLEDSINNSLHDINIELNSEAKINIKPRMRMTTLYGIAQSLGYLVIGTGNLCEIMVGYTTKWGDSASDFNPLGNFTVDEVIRIGEYLGVPDKIIHKAPNDGLGGQTDEEKMGVTYRQIEEVIETGNTDSDALENILRRYNSSKHKRKLVPIYYFERKNFLENN